MTLAEMLSAEQVKAMEDAAKPQPKRVWVVSANKLPKPQPEARGRGLGAGG